MSLLLFGLCTLCLFAGGAVKGVVALGLPLVSVPLLLLVVDLKTAVGLLVLPMIVSNLAQSFQGGLFLSMLRRFWFLNLTLVLGTVLGTRLLVVLPERALDLVVGISVIVLPLVLHFRPEIRIAPRQQRWLDPAVGVVSGLLGGISTFYGPPLMIYVMGLRLTKAEFVAAVSLLYAVAGLGLFLGIYVLGPARLPMLGLSAAMLVPTGIGMWLGRIVQTRLSENAFRYALMAVYLANGTVFLIRAFA